MPDLGNVPASTTIYLPFTTHAASGASVAPSTAYEAADVRLYKNGSATERSSQAGWTMTSPFDSITGLHVLAIDLSDNTDAGFYAAGANYFAVLSADTETVDSLTVVAVIGTFRIVHAEATSGTPSIDVATWNNLATVALPLIPTVAGRTLDVSAGGEAGMDWANVGSPTTAVDLSGTTIKTTQKVDVDTIKTNPVVNGGTITFPTNATVASTTNITAGTVTTATNVTTVNGLAANVITATSINADAITAAKIADGAIDAATFAAGAINAAAIAADAIGASELASDAVTEIRSLVSGTSDSGTATTMVDAARTEADTDYWKGAIIVFTSGNISGQARLITGFNAATDTITYYPATTQAAATQNYEIWPYGTADLTRIDGAAISTTTAQLGVNTVQAGATAWNSGAIKTTSFTAGAIDAAAIATDAIGAAELAADAVTEIQSGLSTLTQANVRTAVGLASANLDTQLAALQSDTDDIQARLPAALTANGNIKADTLRVSGTVQTAGDLAAMITAVDDYVDTEVAAIKAVTDLLPNGGALSNLDAAISTRATPAQVKTQMTDALNVDTYAQPAQEDPAATTTLGLMIRYLYKAFRNKGTQTSTTYKLFNDDAVTVDHKATVSDDGTTFTRGEIGTGP